MSLEETIFTLIVVFILGFFWGAWWERYRIAKYFDDLAKFLKELRR